MQPKNDERMEPMHGMYGTLDVEFEIKRAELTAFLCFVRRVVGPTAACVDDRGVIDGLWTGDEMLGPKAKDADLWILIVEAV